MNAGPDPFEAELAAICPFDPSPGLRYRVAGHLASPTAPRRIGVIVLAGMLASAGVLVAVWWQGPASPGSPVVPAPPATTEPEDAAPSLAVYRKALTRSPEDLDALLDRSATTGGNAEFTQMPVGAYPRSGATLALFGDD